MAKNDTPKTPAPRNSGCNASNTPNSKLLRMGIDHKMVVPSPKTPK